MATSNLLVHGPVNWTSFYERNRHDGGGVQRLFEASLATMSIITASHLKKPEKLVETIAGSTYANMIMVAGDDDGMVNILHHGFVSATSFGGEAAILFLSGNSPEAPVKALSHTSAVVPIKKTSSGRTRGGAATLDAPTFADMWGVESETDFADLRANGNTILRDKPNHMMIGPAVFALADGTQRIRARTLAYQIVARIRDHDDSEDSSEQKEAHARPPGDGGTQQSLNPGTPPANPAHTDNFIEILDSASRGAPPVDGYDSGSPDRGSSMLDDTDLLQRPRGGMGKDDTDDDLARGNDDEANDSVSHAMPLDDSDHIEHLLAWLLACEKKMVASAKLSDPIYDDLLLTRLRSIRAKLDVDQPKSRLRGATRTETTPIAQYPDSDRPTVSRHSRPADTTPAYNPSDGLANLALTTKDIAAVLERMENNRRHENKKKESDKSFLRNLGTMQRELFLNLCTDELGELSDPPKFLKNLMETKTPQKAIAMIRSEIWEWEGSFFDGPFHRFLANGYLARDGNKGSPGGFTLFMFCPKNVEASLNTNKSDIALLRDYFDLDVDDDTINHYARQGWFYPSNHYDLRVQLKTACAMLDLLTGDGSIASHGLSYILNPARWDRYAPLLAERFKTENLFGAKFVYCLDRNLQVFFSKVSKWEHSDPQSVDPDYLRNKAETLFDKIDDGHTLGTILPSTIYGPAGSKRAIERGHLEAAAGDDALPNKKPKTNSPNKRTTNPGPLSATALLDSAEMVNEKTVSEWLLPRGTQYYDFFLSKDRSTRGWPMLDDDRLANSPAPMCIRFQTTGKCREACRMAHVRADAMTADNRKRIGDRFREAYGSRHSST